MVLELNELLLQSQSKGTQFKLRLFFQNSNTVLCLGQDFWGTQVSLYLNFRGTFTNSGGQTKSCNFLPAKLNGYPEISHHFLFNLSSMSIDLAQEGL